MPPKPVEPCHHEGVTYRPIQRGWVRASRDGATLWDLEIYPEEINPRLEADVQHVYITRLWFQEGELRVSDERGLTYGVALETRQVRLLDTPTRRLHDLQQSERWQEAADMVEADPRLVELETQLYYFQQAQRWSRVAEICGHLSALGDFYIWEAFEETPEVRTTQPATGLLEGARCFFRNSPDRLSLRANLRQLYRHCAGEKLESGFWDLLPTVTQQLGGSLLAEAARTRGERLLNSRSGDGFLSPSHLRKICQDWVVEVARMLV